MFVLFLFWCKFCRHNYEYQLSCFCSAECCPSPTNFCEHEKDCTLFYQCDRGEAVLKSCPVGTLWKQNISTCDHDGRPGRFVIAACSQCLSFFQVSLLVVVVAAAAFVCVCVFCLFFQSFRLKLFFFFLLKITHVFIILRLWEVPEWTLS